MTSENTFGSEAYVLFIFVCVMCIFMQYSTLNAMSCQNIFSYFATAAYIAALHRLVDVHTYILKIKVEQLHYTLHKNTFLH